MATLKPFHNTYRCTGSAGDEAPDLVLLHGWGLHSIVWDDVMPALLERFRVTVIDLPGMGQSPLPNQDYTLDFLVEQVREVMPAQCHLVGWSLGGLVAIRLSLRFPQQMLSLVTVACSPCFVARDNWPAAMRADILQKFAELYEEDNEGTLIRFLALNAKGSDTQQQDTAKLRDILYFCGLPAPRALREGLVILRDTDLRDAVKELKQPVLMLFGEHDHIVPAAALEAVRELAPQVEMALMQGVSHVPQVSAPDIFARALQDFWRDAFPDVMGAINER